MFHIFIYMKTYFYILITFLSLDLSAQTYTYYDANNGLEGLDTWSINALTQTQSGTIWAASQYGLFKYENNAWSHILLPTQGWSPQICKAIDSYGDTLWVATQADGLWKITPDTMINYHMYNSGLPHDWMHTLAVDTNGIVWMCCEGLREFDPGFGLTRFDGNTWGHFTVNNSTIGLENILKMGIDANNHLWMVGGTNMFNGPNTGLDLVRYNGN